MKRKVFLMTMLLTAALQLTPILFAQDNQPRDQGPRRNRHEHLANLTPEERQKLQAAHRKAMHDPALRAAHDKLRQARNEFRDTLHAAMVKADPTLQPILDKLPKDTE
jgi:Spy/CpxP family protein refolding chaperone